MKQADTRQLEITRQEKTSRQEEQIRRDWKDLMDTYLLSDEQKLELWTAIKRKQAKRKRIRKLNRVLGTAAAIICVVAIGTGGVNKVTRGKMAESIRQAGGDKLADAIRKLCGMEPQSVQILQNQTPEAAVYAPPLLDCNKNQVVFANSRGMIIYNRKQQAVAATIDLQETGCNYFTAQSLQTRVITQGNQIFIFNAKDGQAVGNCYIYELTEDRETVEHLAPIKVVTASESLQKQWERTMQGRYSDTFDSMGSGTVDTWQTDKAQETKYSACSMSWSDSSETYLSCLLLRGQEYSLYTKNQTTGEITEELLPIHISAEAANQAKMENILPEFVYTGEDEIIKAVCTWLVQEKTGSYYMQPDVSYTLIPAPVIYGILEEDNETKVFGNFYTSIYYKNGNTLEEEGGSEMPACFHLQKTQEGYRVIRVEKTGDGSYYEKGIRKFCQGHMDLYEKFFDDHQTYMEQREQTLSTMIRQYVEKNGLDIRYYHAFGWDPVDLYP